MMNNGGGDKTTYFLVEDQEDICFWASSAKTSYLVALHDLNLAIHFCDEVVMLKDGHVYDSGPAEEVITEESIRDVNGVESEIVEGRGGKFVHICEDIDPNKGC